MQERKAEKTEKIEVEFGNLYTKEAESFGLAIMENNASFAKAEDGIYAQKITDAAYKSVLEKRFIEV